MSRGMRGILTRRRAAGGVVYRRNKSGRTTARRVSPRTRLSDLARNESGSGGAGTTCAGGGGLGPNGILAHTQNLRLGGGLTSGAVFNSSANLSANSRCTRSSRDSGTGAGGAQRRALR